MLFSKCCLSYSRLHLSSKETSVPFCKRIILICPSWVDNWYDMVYTGNVCLQEAFGLPAPTSTLYGSSKDPCAPRHPIKYSTLNRDPDPRRVEKSVSSWCLMCEPGLWMELKWIYQYIYSEQKNTLGLCADPITPNNTELNSNFIISNNTEQYGEFIECVFHVICSAVANVPLCLKQTHSRFMFKMNSRPTVSSIVSV